MVQPDIIERNTTSLITTDEGDHERFAHIVVPASAVTEAYIYGTPVTALCGKTWVPSRAPEKYPLCPTCDEILDEIKRIRN